MATENRESKKECLPLFENCKLIAHFDGEGWMFEVSTQENQIIATLDYEAMFGTKKVSTHKLEKLGIFEIV